MVVGRDMVVEMEVVAVSGGVERKEEKEGRRRR